MAASVRCHTVVVFSSRLLLDLPRIGQFEAVLHEYGMVALGTSEHPSTFICLFKASFSCVADLQVNLVSHLPLCSKSCEHPANHHHQRLNPQVVSLKADVIRQ